jgi:transcriptional regulator with XRE-family HTH domain
MSEQQGDGRRRRRKSDKPSPIDVHVGSRVRLRRTLLGMSQERLGNAIGLTFQQVQKYERGANRIGASRLFDLSRVLDVPVSFFFDDLNPGITASVDGGVPGASESATASAAHERDPMMRRETLELVRAYYRVPDAQTRRRLFELVKAIANAHAVTQAEVPERMP